LATTALASLGTAAAAATDEAFLVPPASPRAGNEALCDRTVGWFPLATVVSGAGILPFVSFPFRTKKERGRGCRRPFIAVV